MPTPARVRVRQITHPVPIRQSCIENFWTGRVSIRRNDVVGQRFLSLHATAFAVDAWFRYRPQGRGQPRHDARLVHIEEVSCYQCTPGKHGRMRFRSRNTRPGGARLAATRLTFACQEMKTPQCLNEAICAIAGLVSCLVTQLSPFC
jgi:hypothetical protein